MAELAGERLDFPATGAPHERRTWLAEFAAPTGVDVGTTGSTHGDAQRVDDVTSGAATGFGAGAPPAPPGTWLPAGDAAPLAG
ncbi:hypothetical protein [Kineococcus indalonis]|uniref:hypothetical protein n=1 Tax=Kineococcus indalonis TaxID=2696566 RepID=UPI001411CC87|nr:hypothetical protein [Kineococcus indalonis]NAZ86651.1 hypothetical protein [Kineococcus indalonis]